MCSVFGLIDHKQALTTRERSRLLNVLVRECEVRGTDATGIAYHFSGRLRIFKRPLPARKLRLRVPQGVHVIMGHTRMTTQGNEKFNQNNHPFAGAVSGKPFALAHNGILWNDKTLRAQEHLPQTSVETDSFIAVQLLEQQKTLDFASLKNMAEKVEGSFVFTVPITRTQSGWSRATTRCACFTTMGLRSTHPRRRFWFEPSGGWLWACQNASNFRTMAKSCASPRTASRRPAAFSCGRTTPAGGGIPCMNRGTRRTACMMT